MTAGINVVSHPLVQHKLSLMRERDRSIKGFRELLNEIGMLLCYEVTRDLPLELVEIETVDIVAERIRNGLKFVAADRLVPAPDCGMKYMPRATAFGKLKAMCDAAAKVRKELS